MFAEERRKRIVDLIRDEGRVEVKDLAARFEVTEDAIRKDLRLLDKEGLVRKIYGGAVLPTKLPEFVAYKDRGVVGKLPFAKAAVSLIKPGDTVFIESSTFTNLMFSEMPKMDRVTVVTNSIHGLSELAAKANVIHVGGMVHEGDESSYGLFALQVIGQINFDKCFLRTSGISPEWQVTASLQESLALKQAVIKQSSQSVMLIVHSNWNMRGRYNVCDMREIDTVITNTKEASVLDKLNDNGINILTVN